jgi:DNA-binding CsgD family transcriptional regulator
VACAPDLHPVARRQIIELAGGNPLALIELPRQLSAGQVSGAESVPDAIPLTDRLQQLFAARAEGLTPASRELLLLAALDSRSHAFGLLVGEASDALVDAEASGLVLFDPVRQHLHFRHPLTRAAIVELSSADERRVAHSRLADASVERYDRALHRGDATVGFDADVARELNAAAVIALERGDVVRSSAILVRAAELTPDPRERARRLAEAAYLGSHVAGTLTSAQAMLHRARLANPDATSTLHSATAAASHLANRDGGVDAAHRVLMAALDATPREALDSNSVEAAATTLQFICTFAGRAELWKSLQGVTARYADLLPRALVIASHTFADPARATTEHLAELEGLMEEIYVGSHPLKVMQVAIAGHYVDRMPRDAVAKAVDDARSGGALAACATGLILLAVDAFMEGRWDEAVELADECVAVCEDAKLRAIQCGGINPRMLVAAGRGDREFLQASYERMESWGMPRGARAVTTFMANIDGLLALGEGRFTDACAKYARIAAPGEFPPHEQVTMWSVLDVVEALVGAGRPEDARAHVIAAREVGLDAISDRLKFLCAAASALVAAPSAADDLFESALRDYDGSRWPFFFARLELAYGDHLRREREARQARPHLERAADMFRGLRATPWVARAEASLRATGRTRRRGAAYGQSELTPQEAEVADLAAAGLTNKEIAERLHLSARTVGGHLYRLFPKLGVTNRASLRDALTRLREPDR